MEGIVALVDQVAAEAGRQRKRKADEISQFDAEIEALKQKRLHVERDLEQLALVERLKTDGGEAWEQLEATEKWHKVHVLAVLLCADWKLPRELREDHWMRHGFVPPELYGDRDILLARLARKESLDCYTYFWKYGGDPIIPLFQIPQQLHHDKQVLIATLSCYPEILMQDFVSDEFLDDSEVFLAFIQSDRLEKQNLKGLNCNGNSTLFNLVSKFSRRIRGNKALMLQAAKYTSTNSVMEHFSAGLACDLSFVQELVVLLDEAPNEDSLGRFEEPIRADRNIVLAFVRKNGRCLKHAAQSLRSDSDVVRAACHNDASALAFVAPQTGTESPLGKDKDFLLQVFSQWPREQPGDPALYERLLSPMLKLDYDLIAEAHTSGNLSLTDLPPELTEQDRNGFWKEIIKHESSFWRILPSDLADNVAFARAINSFCDNELVADVFGRFPFLQEERSVWQVIIASTSSDRGLDLLSVIERLAPAAMLQDKTLMVQACEKDYEVYGILDAGLQQDSDLVEAAINCSGRALKLIPHSVQTPETVIKALAALRFDDRFLVSDNEDGSLVAEALWTNMDVVRAWFDAGGCFCPNNFPESMANNEELGLALAVRFKRVLGPDHYQEKLNIQFRNAISADLRSNKDFMMKVCQHEPYFFAEAVGDLRRDVHLAIMAFGGHRDADVLTGWLLGNKDDSSYFHQDDAAYNKELQFLHSVQSMARSYIAHYESFTKCFVPAMSEHAGPHCHLRMLANGVETSEALKKLIASYLGVPSAYELPILRKIVDDLDRLPNFRHICDCSHCARSHQ